MFGRRLDAMYTKREIIKGDIIFEGINIKSDYLNNISFNLKRGEILGVFGLLGAGQKDLTATIFGIKKRNYGDFLINGKKVLINSPIDAIKNGIAFLSDERKKDGLILTQNVKENITTASINKISKFFKMNLRMEAKIANAWKERFDIKTPSIFTLIENLSGGNQQKVILAKWLETNPKVLILNEPTRGIDVGSKVEIYRLMEEFCDKGIGIIMVSSELPEIIQLADRVIVLSRGRKTGEFDRKDITQVNLLHSAIGEN
jgi:ribose transport system ATP-binding protein